MDKILNNSIKAVIHQPYFLPWPGYFAKLVCVDKFIVLDNAFFTKRKYIDRVQIINAQGQPMWVGLPIGQHFNEPCNAIHFSDKTAIDKIIKNFHASYSKAKHFKDNIQHIENILLHCFDNSDVLSEINMNIIVKLMQLLKLKMPEIIFSSQFQEINDTTDRVIMLCKKTQCDTIIVGSINGTETHDLNKFTANNIGILFQDFYNNQPIYYQTRRTNLGFAKGLSIVDCIFNEGLEKTKLLLHLNQNKIISSVGGVEKRIFSTAAEADKYIAEKIHTAEDRVYDLNWQDNLSSESHIRRDKEERTRSQTAINNSIKKFCSEKEIGSKKKKRKRRWLTKKFSLFHIKVEWKL